MRDSTQRVRLALLCTATLLLLGAWPRLIDGLKKAELTPGTPGVGRLLVARPGEADFLFDSTVVLVLEVGEEGTLGLVLNRTRTPRGRALPPGVDRWGGPVRRRGLSTLVRAQVPPAQARPVLPDLYWLPGPRPEGVSEAEALTFMGLASWGPGQLSEELAAGGWLVLEGGTEAVFSAPEALWAASIAHSL